MKHILGGKKGLLNIDRTSSKIILKVQNLTIYYGSMQVLNNISLVVQRGEIVALIGPNGAGKSTTLKAICGLLRVTGGEIKRGEIFYKGKSIKGYPPHKLAKEGIALVPEGRRVFPTMSVLENLEMGGYIIKSGGLKWKSSYIRERIEKVFDLFPILKKKQKHKAGTLSGGEQQMLAIGRALMLQPELLFLDEPSLGLSPNYVEEVFDKLKEINKAGTTILLVEQNVNKALEYAHRAYVFKTGRIAFESKTENLIENDEVRKLFLGYSF